MRFSLFSTGKMAPIFQGLFSIFSAFLLGIVAKIIHLDNEMIYVFICAPLILFCFLNPAIAGFTKAYKVYMILSLPVFIITMGTNYLLLKLIATLNSDISWNLTMMYMLLIVFFFLAHTVGLLFKQIRQFLEGSS